MTYISPEERGPAAVRDDMNEAEAHSAVYDAERTALLFCAIVNRWKAMSDAFPAQ